MSSALMMEARARAHLSQKVVVQLVAGDHIQVTGGVNGGRECRGVRPSGSDQGAHSVDLALHEHISIRLRLLAPPAEAAALVTVHTKWSVSELYITVVPRSAVRAGGISKAARSTARLKAMPCPSVTPKTRSHSVLTKGPFLAMHSLDYVLNLWVVRRSRYHAEGVLLGLRRP